MKTINVDGVDILFHMEQTGDGGMVISTLVPMTQPNEYRTFREWIGKGITTLPDGTVVQPTPAETEAARDQARAVYNALTVAEARARADKAMAEGTF